MADVILKNINKIYPNGVQAVFDFNLDIKHGEFIVFAGPSGCGKSTTLRMVAGLEEISSGELYIDGKECSTLSPKDRDIAMVFQNYALYAHMTVYHNMAFSLVLRKEKAEIIHERVMEAAKILGLVPYLNRKPKQLSGGQRQRVALGRAIVRNPKVFLLDEPLSNLDAKLRGVMRKELSTLHSKLGTTFIYVTHDQIEALTLADRIVVMKDGYIQQVATPKDIFDYPDNIFVATFIGTPPMNLYEGVYEEGYFVTGNSKIYVGEDNIKLLDQYGYNGKTVIMASRPEYVYVDDAHLAEYEKSSFTFDVDYSELLGSHTLVYGEFEGHRVIIKRPFDQTIKTKTAKAAFDPAKLLFFDKETTNRIKDGSDK